MQALYQVIVGRNPPEDVDSFTRELSGFHKADSVHFDALLHGCAAQAEALDAHSWPTPLDDDHATPLRHTLAQVLTACLEFASNRSAA